MLTPSNPELWPFLLMLFAAGAGAGLLAGMFGIGGGAVLVPVFYQIFGVLGVEEAVRMHLSVGTSIAIIVPTSLRSFFAHRGKGAVDIELLKSFIMNPFFCKNNFIIIIKLHTTSIYNNNILITYSTLHIIIYQNKQLN